MRKFFTPLKVGILTIIAVGGFVFALRSVEKGVLGGHTYQVYAVFDDVLGVAKRSRVVMAGIEVGYIDSIELEGARARLNIRIRSDVQLYRDASIAKISESLLGDKLIDLSPGKDIEHPIPDGGQIVNVYEERDFGELFRKLDLITEDIRTVTHSLANTIGDFDREDSLGGVMRRMTEISKNVAELTQRVNESFQTGSDKVQRILDDVAGVTAGTRGRYQEILDGIQAVTTDMRTLLANLNDIVGRGGEDWKDSVGGMKETLQKASRSLENIDNITRKIDEGQGTLGRLVNDDKVLDKAEGVLDDASTFTSKLARLQTIIDLRSEYHIRQNAAKNYLALKLVPKSDKYYMLEVIDDPRGAVSVESKKECGYNDDGDYICTVTDSTTTKDEFKFSIQFAKRFYWLGLRFGIIEGTGGLGMNWYFLNDDLEFRFDVFQFGKNEYGDASLPRLKAMVMYRPTWLANHIYLAGGVDDVFNQEPTASQKKSSFDYFFGAGIHFDDEDLKAIFTAVGTPNL
jgi:phospholipid/cholesterol/gamma-HCH transport system substrate-binding protein